MNFETDQNGNVIVTCDNKIYSFMNFKDYVGHRSRQWYEEGPDCFRLFKYEEPGKLTITGTVYESGNYIDLLLIDEQDNRRSIVFRGDLITSDIIYTKGENAKEEGRFVSFDDYRYETMPSVKKYFEVNHEFISNDGKKFEGFLTDSSLITDFFRAGEEMIPSVIEYVQNNKKTL